MNFQTRICPTCFDDHSAASACDINDLLQIPAIQKVYKEPMRIVVLIYESDELHPLWHDEAMKYEKILKEKK